MKTVNVQPDAETPHPNVEFRITNTLLVQAQILDIDVSSFIEFLFAQTQVMVTKPPNIGRGHDHRVWVVRGFYPDTTLFFKLCVIKNEKHTFIKASPLEIKIGGKYSSWPKTFTLDGNNIEKSMTDNMENSFFGANHSVKPLIAGKIHLPRCMSPKGMKLFKLKKKKRETT